MTTPALDDNGLPERYGFDEAWEITPREVRDRLATDPSILLLDVRTPDEYETASIAHATLMPMQVLGGRMAEIDAHKEKPIFVMCHKGGRSLRVTEALRRQGFADVKSMAGGIDLWAVDIDPAIDRY